MTLTLLLVSFYAMLIAMIGLTPAILLVTVVAGLAIAGLVIGFKKTFVR